MSLHYRIDGPANGAPLILVNGLFAGLDSWGPAMQSLAEFRVLRYDGRGQGQSPKPQGCYSMDVLLDDLVGLLDALDWPASHVVGISNGGCVALALAATHPQRTRCVVAADCTATPSPLLKLKIQSWLAAHRVGGPQHRFDVATPWIWSDALLRSRPDLVAHYRALASDHRDDAVEGLLTGALSHRIDLRPIQAPVLLLCGREDILTPEWEMRAMLPELSMARLRAVPGGHASLLENPVIFDETIVPFLGEVHSVG